MTRELTTEEKELVAFNEARGYRYKKAHTSTTAAQFKRLPGHVLVEEFLVPYYPAELSDLAYRTKIPLKRLNKLIRGQDRIDTFMAERLGRFFGNGTDFWMDIQTRYESGKVL